MGRTNGIDVLLDFAAHPKDVLTALPSLSAEQLNQHPEGHPNSIAWLLWHTGRGIDVQLSALTGNDECGIPASAGLPWRLATPPRTSRKPLMSPGCGTNLVGLGVKCYAAPFYTYL